ncbi:MAG: hypothetical protein F6K19_50540, partial [Cyanothece sp. SIO1E1]|nr:hypothetical protein [Cyanothece sp. SIO1E1]
GIILGVGGLVALAAIPVHLMMIMIRLGGLIVITMAGVIMVAIVGEVTVMVVAISSASILN